MINSYNLCAYEDMKDTSLSNLSQSEYVVIFASCLTDIRIIVKTLTNHDIPCKVIEMEMGALHSRTAFKKLCKMTQWRLLPQIFVNGRFIGGIDELFNHPSMTLDVMKIKSDKVTLQ